MSNISAVFDTIRNHLPEIEYRLDEPMKNHTSFKIGGSVKAMLFPKSQKQVIALAQILKEWGIKPLVIGNGSNILADDRPLDLVVIKTHGGLTGLKLTGETEITAESGVLLSKLAQFAMEHGLTGLEFAHGIPGTFGGAVFMNAGAYGGEIKDVVTETTALSPDLSVFVSKDEDHQFAYRHSRFSGTEDIILSSVIQLAKSSTAEIKAEMDALSAKRRASQPLNLPSAGSTFKRPQGGYAAALIEQAGLKGFGVGGAVVSEKHAGFIVNRGDATFYDVMAVIDHVKTKVMSQFGIALEPEVKIIRSGL